MSSQSTKRGDSRSMPSGRQARKMPWSPRVSAFLVCLLLAGAFWFIHVLSEEYTDQKVKVPVSFVNLPAGRLMPGNLPDSLEVKVTASGFSLLTLEWMTLDRPLELDLSRARSIGGGNYAIVTNSQKYSLLTGMGKEIQVNKVLPDTVIIAFEGKMEKSVPVRPRVTISTAPSYRIGDSLRPSPEFVTISGPEALLDKISFIETEAREYIDVSANIDEDVRLVLPEGITQVSVQPAIVHLHAGIGKYTEGRFTIPLNTMNVPPNVDLKTFPDKVDVIFQVPVEDFATLKPEMFRAVADYRKVQPGSQSLLVEIVKAPIIVRQLRAEPTTVDFIIRK